MICLRVSPARRYSRSRVGVRSVAPRWSLLAVVLAVLLAGGGAMGCAGPAPSLEEDPADYADEVARLQATLADDPDDADALRDLGAIYVRTGRPTEAYDRLKTAYARQPDDPKTQFFLGIASERVGKRDAALQLFQGYDGVPEDSRYRDLMRGRYQWLLRQEARASIQRRMAQELTRDTEGIDPRTVALMPLNSRTTGDARYQAIGRGMAEMMATDLAVIDRIVVVERIRLQALLDELELASSSYVDPSTAPRVGQLLGAGRLVGGSYDVSDSERLRLTVSVADVIDGQVRDVTAQEGPLAEFFRLQTKLVFDLLDAFGVTLTPAERDAIEEVPTRDLQAFLAYGRGLLEEDRGNFRGATQQFRQAREIDPGFREAARAETRAQDLSDAGGPPANAVASAEPGSPGVDTQRLLDRRVQTMTGFDAGALGTGAPSDQITVIEDVLQVPPPPPPSAQPAGGS